jgi:proteic killer suppression protein
MEKIVFDKVEKRLRKLPLYIVDKLMEWALSVELKGISEIRKRPGYHDEPLKGHRLGQRSIRLSKGYRAIYREEDEGAMRFIVIEEIHKHEY